MKYRAGFGTRKVGKRSEWDFEQLAYIAEIAEQWREWFALEYSGN